MYYTSELDEYIQTIERYPILPYPEQLALLIDFQKHNNKKAFDKVVQSNLRFVVKLANKYQHLSGGISIIDLIQEGNIGLIEGLKKFKPELKYKITTYSAFWIRQKINRYLCSHSRTIRLPEALSGRIHKILKTQGELFFRLQRDPTLEEIATHSKIKLNIVTQVFNNLDEILSLDFLKANTDELPLVECIKNPETEQPLQIDFDKLTYEQSNIIKLRYGFIDNSPWTIEKIAKKLKFTIEKTKTLLEAALEILAEQNPHLLENEQYQKFHHDYEPFV